MAGCVKPGTSDAGWSAKWISAHVRQACRRESGGRRLARQCGCPAGAAGRLPDRPPLLVEQGMPLALRQGPWKFIAGSGKGKRGKQSREPADEKIGTISIAANAGLYNLANDIAETRNLAQANPQKAQELPALLEKIRQPSVMNSGISSRAAGRRRSASAAGIER